MSEPVEYQLVRTCPSCGATLQIEPDREEPWGRIAIFGNDTALAVIRYWQCAHCECETDDPISTFAQELANDL